MFSFSGDTMTNDHPSFWTGVTTDEFLNTFESSE